MPPLRVVAASDAFSGSLTSLEVGAAVAAGVHEVLPTAEVVLVPVADGGEGTVAAALAAGFRAVPAPVHGPTGAPVTATLAVREDPGSGRTVVVELADACGRGRLPGGVPAPLAATSRGLGEAIRAALDLRPARLVVGVGGSASTDGGSGMLAALGARVLDTHGAELAGGGGALPGLGAVDLGLLDRRLREVELVLAADVDSPLLGPRGAAAVFGPQKGASPTDVAVLEAGLATWARAVAPDAVDRPGAGAAGGVGFALLGVLGAQRRPGAALVADLVGLDRAVVGADLVVTGEGSLDTQTLAGKAVGEVARRAGAAGVPVVAVCGRCLLGPEELAALGVAAAYPLSALEPDPRRSVADAAELVRRTAARIARDRLSRRPG